MTKSFTLALQSVSPILELLVSFLGVAHAMTIAAVANAAVKLVVAVLTRAATTPAHLQGEAVAINRGEGIESDGHWSWEGETRASLNQQYSLEGLQCPPVTKLHKWERAAGAALS
jgi:hypothetical protein